MRRETANRNSRQIKHIPLRNTIKLGKSYRLFWHGNQAYPMSLASGGSAGPSSPSSLTAMIFSVAAEPGASARCCARWLRLKPAGHSGEYHGALSLKKVHPAPVLLMLGGLSLEILPIKSAGQLTKMPP